MSKETKIKLSMIEDEKIAKEIKVLLLLEMVHQEEIGITKAKELCTEAGIFSEHWMAVDAKATDIYEKLYKMVDSQPFLKA